jgi:hypothetical protein
LAGIHFKFSYRPGLQNGKRDALSWSTEYRPLTVGCEEQQIQTIPQEKHFENKLYLNTNKEEVIVAPTKLPIKRWITWNTEFLEEVKEQGVKDERCSEGL